MSFYLFVIAIVGLLFGGFWKWLIREEDHINRKLLITLEWSFVALLFIAFFAFWTIGN